jgi:NAD(P)-dependent dehydrogenase (short-subunit alcohol dehydrogenase family)
VKGDKKMQLFTDKVALVTGGGSGIGRAISLSFAERGAIVIVVGRTQEKITETQEMISKMGGQAISLQVNVSSDEQVKEMIQTVANQFGRLDFACNAAGVGKLAPFANISETDFDSTIAVNLKGVWLCMKYQIQQMLSQDAGVIVNISSINALGGTPNAAVYAASKAGVNSLTKTAALEYAKSNIRINAICPGPIRTPMLKNIIDDAGITDSHYESVIPQGRIGNPNDIANSTMWLCSDETSYMNGHIMVIDGGIAARG